MNTIHRVHNRRAARGQWLRWAVTVFVVCQMILIPQAGTAQDVPAQDVPAQAAGAQADARPGSANPTVPFSEWRDDEFFMTLPVLSPGNQWRMGIFAPNSAMTETVTADSQDFPDSTTMVDGAAGAGRILGPSHEYAVYAARQAQNVAISFFRPQTAQPVAVLPGLADPAGTSSDFLDVSVGDLDGMPAADAELRDEVVVAYAQHAVGNPLPVTVAVLDFAGASEDAPTPTAVTTAAGAGTLDAAEIASGAVLHGDGGLDSAVGDYDGDGVKEIMVAYISAAKAVTVDVFRYTVTNGSGGVQRTLARVGSSVLDIPQPIANISFYLHATLSLVMADLDGDNMAEAALATTVTGAFRPPQEWASSPLLFTLEVTGANPAAIRVAHSTYLWTETNLDTTFYGAIQLAPGLFKVDPAHGWNLNRRQLAVAYYSPSSYSALPSRVTVGTFIIGSDLTISLNYSSWGSININNAMTRFALGAGGYAGATSSDNPYWYSNLTIWDGKGVTHYYLKTREDSLTLVGPPLTWTTREFPSYGDRLPLIPIDYDGDTVYLGAPVHLVIENVVSTDFILEEPPKHAYWDAGLKTVANVSRVDGFNISLVKSDKEEFSATSKDTTDWSIGSSAAASAAETVGANVNVGIVKESAELTTQISGKVGYDYQQHEADFTSSYADRTVSYTGVTTRDDYIVGRLQTLDVWRYRLFGAAATAPGDSVFYDLVMPGPYQNLLAAAGGLSFDWYQPTHENGNILSYPQFDNSTFTPADLGTFTLPGSDTPVKQLLLEPSQRAWDATSDSISLNFSSASGGGSERSYSHTMAENASIKTTFKGSASVGLGKMASASASFNATAEVELHNKNSWGNAVTANSKTTSSTGITLNKASGTAEMAYFFYPVMYVATDGTSKVTYAVDPLSHPTGKAWWAEQYGQQPDLALNLPMRFTTMTNDSGVVKWTPTKSIVRKQMRGFFVYKDEVNPVTGDHDLITNAVLGGTKVRLEARVYNYSLGQSVPAGAVVRFEAAPYDPNTNQEGARFPVAETTLPLMAPRQMVTAAATWDTASITWEAGNTRHYRIYVVLDPDNQVANEKYETESAATQTFCFKVSDAQPNVCIDPGQNNEGYGYVTVRRQLPGDPNWNRPDANVSMAADGLQALDAGGNLTGGSVQAAFGRPLDLRVTIHSDKPSADFAVVLVFDGDPALGGRLIAGRSIFAGAAEAEGSSMWLQWVPLTGGTHTLFAKVLQSIHDPAPGNNVSQLRVEVQGGEASNLLYMPMIGQWPAEP